MLFIPLSSQMALVCKLFVQQCQSVCLRRTLLGTTNLRGVDNSSQQISSITSSSSQNRLYPAAQLLMTKLILSLAHIVAFVSAVQQYS